MYCVLLYRNCNPGNLRKHLGLSGIARSFNPAFDAAAAPNSLEPFIRTNSIFVHIPKAAGVSVARALYGNLGFGHRKLRDYQEIFRPAVFERMFKFTIVRNPFDRLHSAYVFLNNGGWGREDEAFRVNVLSRYPDFQTFVLEGLQEERVLRYYHFIPQDVFLETANGPLADIDFVGRLESLPQDFEKIRQRVNPQAQLKHENRSVGREPGDFRRHYTSEMVDVVNRVYGRSLALLDYSFDPP